MTSLPIRSPPSSASLAWQGCFPVDSRESPSFVSCCAPARPAARSHTVSAAMSRATPGLVTATVPYSSRVKKTSPSLRPRRSSRFLGAEASRELRLPKKAFLSLVAVTPFPPLDRLDRRCRSISNRVPCTTPMGPCPVRPESRKRPASSRGKSFIRRSFDAGNPRPLERASPFGDDPLARAAFRSAS